MKGHESRDNRNTSGAKRLPISIRVRAGQGKSWKTGISGKTLMVTGKSGIVRNIDKSQGKLRK